jgi:hypothetical protein
MHNIELMNLKLSHSQSTFRHISLAAPVTKVMEFLSLQKVKTFLEPAHDFNSLPMKCAP